LNSEDFTPNLLEWYQKHKRDLPWRNTADPYKIWVSEVMLQQTTVPVVVPYYKKWLRRFPDAASVSRASEQTILKLWEGLGYYRRAKNLHRSAQIITSRYRGKIPCEYDQLIQLPGFGPYTAAAVLSIAFQRPYPVIDANVRRVGMRLLQLTSLSVRKNEAGINRFLTAEISKTEPGRFNQAVMELGALICLPRNPPCRLCPVIRFCRAYRSGIQEIIPPPKKKQYKQIEAVVGIIKNKNRFFIQQRPGSGLLAGLWEFPGGKKQSGELLTAALEREVREETGMDVVHADPLITVRHAYTQYQVKLHAFLCRVKSLPKELSLRQRWVTLTEMNQYPFPSGSVKIIRFLEQKDV
jgi:A/G-specific adenine glycosylase